MKTWLKKLNQLDDQQRRTLAACFLGWALDAFDFLLVILVAGSIAQSFRGDAAFEHLSRWFQQAGFLKYTTTNVDTIPVFFVISLTLAMRPLGALIFGIIADRRGRLFPLWLDILCFAVLEFLTAFSPNFIVFLVLRLLFGIAMGGEWGVGMAMAMESLYATHEGENRDEEEARGRGLFSGILQTGYSFGYLLAAIVTYAVATRVPSDYVWRVALALGVLPALLALYIRSNLQESPVWMERKARDRELVGLKEMRSAFRRHWPRFVYIVVLMTAFNFLAHGSQDVYPIFLQSQPINLSLPASAQIAMLYSLGAIAGGIVFGDQSQVSGRRFTIMVTVALSLVLIPLWTGLFPWWPQPFPAPTSSLYPFAVFLLIVGAVLMQFTVHGAWGVVPAYLSEESPSGIRSTFPGLAYQIGTLLGASAPLFVAYLAQSPSGVPNYAIAHAIVLLCVCIGLMAVVAVGPEEGKEARDSKLPPTDRDEVPHATPQAVA
jgi:SHS family lactate transporter-like MFS transporter